MKTIMKTYLPRLIKRALVFLALLFLFINPAYSQEQAIGYLCELGKAFYEQGRMDDAISEFNKVLVVDPENKTAKKYINLIFSESSSPQKDENTVVVYNEAAPVSKRKQWRKLYLSFRKKIQQKILTVLRLRLKKTRWMKKRRGDF